MENEQVALSFGKGITNVPSDATCDDNELEECVGMVFAEGEHRVVQKPVKFATGAPKIIFIHRYNALSRYIAYDNSTVKWGEVSNGAYVHQHDVMTAHGVPSVTAIGKVLIVNDNDGMHFFLWKDNAYTDYSTDMPEIFMDLWLDPTKEIDEHDNPIHLITGRSFLEDYVTHDTFLDIGEFNLPTDKEKYDGWQNAVIGAISERIDTLHKLGAFCFPFWVRYGIVMYDDSVTHLSAPILVMPSVLHGAYMEHSDSDGNDEVTCENVNFSYYFKPDVAFGFLRAQLSADAVNTLNAWKDIISGIRIYVSQEVKPFELEGVWDFFNVVAEEDITILTDSVCKREWSTAFFPVQASSWHSYSSKRRKDDNDEWILGNLTTFVLPKQKTEEEIRKELIDNSVFYKLVDIDITEVSTSIVSLEDKFGKNLLQNITTQDILENDDYFSHAKTKADYMFPYNGRLNIAGIERMPFEGSHQFMLCETISAYDFVIRVYIDVDGEEIIASHTVNRCRQMSGKYFYYPDPRAKKAEVYTKDAYGAYKLLYTFTLKEHPGLNGAYYFGGFPNANDKAFDSVMGYSDNCYPQLQDVALPSYVQKAEHLSNTIQTSEVNNPFLFLAKGTFKVGVGTIKAMSTVTHALSQGQFGGFPLLVFADSGMWAATLDNEGYFKRVDPLSREVCNNSKSVMQTDNAVYFSSDKGLMVLVGSDRANCVVRCVSEQMSGKTRMFKDGSNNSLVIDLGNFCDYLKDAFIAYDYRDSLLWIFNGTSRYCYIYAIKSGTFSNYDFGDNGATPPADIIITNVVNDYPDYLLQAGGDVYSLLERPDINADGQTVGGEWKANRYAAKMLTRPMKFDNALALKSIRQIKIVRDMEGQLKYRLFASNDLKSWRELRSLRGMPWKYFKLHFDFTNMIATDRFGGAVIVSQERRTNKLR